MEQTRERNTRRTCCFVLAGSLLVILAVPALWILHFLLRIKVTDAAVRGDLKTVRILLTLDPYLLNSREPADSPVYQGPLWPARLIVVAANDHRKPVVLYLVRKGADLSVDRTWALVGSPLHSAAEWGDLDVVKAMLERGADPNAADAMGLSPVHYAVRAGNRKAWTLLKAYGGRSSSRVHELAAFGELDELRSLVDRNPQLVNAKELGLTPLDYAAPNKHPSVVRFLLEHNARVGKHSLECAVRSRDLETVEILLAHGAHVSGYALRLADESNDTRLRHLVRKHADREPGPK